MRKVTVTIAGLVVAAGALAGCTATSQMSSVASPSPTAAAVAPAADASPSLPFRDRCNPNQGPHIDDLAISRGAVRPEAFTTMRDLGARPRAAGRATLHPDGRLAFYVVAPDDALVTIAERFCLEPMELSVLNEVRRNDIRDGDEIHPGDTLNLDPCTITTVGDVNGQVRHNTPTFTLPWSC